MEWIQNRGLHKCPQMNPITLCVLVGGSKQQSGFDEDDCKYLKGRDNSRADCKAVSPLSRDGGSVPGALGRTAPPAFCPWSLETPTSFPAEE